MIEDALGITKYTEPSEKIFTQFSLVDNPQLLMSNWFHNTTQNIVSSSTITISPVTHLLSQYADIVGIRYRYFRADLEVAIIVRASAQYYGSLVVSWYPADVSLEYSLLNSDPLIIDITTGGMYILRIPYSSVYEAYDVTTTNMWDNNKTPVPYVYISCRYVRSVNSTQPTPQFTVMNRFVNPTFYGTTVRTGVAQMSIRSAVSTLDQSAAKVFTNPYMATATLAVGLDSAGVLPITHVAGKVMSYYREAQKAYKEGSDMADSARSVYGAMKDGVSSMFARDQHESEAAGEVRNAPTPTGYLPSMTYTAADILDPGSAFRIAPTNLADGHMEHYIRELCQTRCIQSDIAWTSTAQDFDLNVHPMMFYDNSAFGWPYASFFSQFFRYWRGSFDIDFLFFTSPLITARFVINCFTEGATLSKPSVTINGGNHFLKRIDVAGFTKVSIRVPFVYSSQWCEMYPYNSTTILDDERTVPSRLNMHLESPVTGGGDQSPQVYMMCLIRAGPDYQVRSFQGNAFYHFTPALKGAKVGEAQMHVRSMESEYENMYQGGNPYLYRELPEDFMSVEDCCLRWSSREALPLQAFMRSDDYEPVGDSLDHLIAAFRYARGCIQVKAVRPTEFPDQSYYLEGTPLPGAGTLDPINSGEYRTYLSLNPVITFEIPMLAHTDWFVIHSDTVLGPTQWPVATSDSSLANYYARAGRGFQIAFLNPPMSSAGAVTMFSG